MVKKASAVQRMAEEAGLQGEPRPAGSTEVDPEEQDFVEDLRGLGVEVSGVHQLREPAQRAEVRDVVFDHLGRDYSDDVRCRLAGALGGPKISAAEFDRLVAAYRAEASDDVRERLADSVARSAGGRLEDVVPLIEDSSLGGSRVLLVKAFTRSKKPEARKVLKGLKDDPDLKVEIADRLK